MSFRGVFGLRAAAILKTCFTLIAVCFFSLSSRAETYLETKGRNYACRDASQMNLWDLAGNSPLIRHQMVEKNYCWQTAAGVKFVVVERVDRFVKLYNNATGQSFFAYASDLGTPRIFEMPEPQPPKTLEWNKVRFVKVKNTSEFGTVLIRGLPTVEVQFDAGEGLKVDFTIVKEKIVAGFEQKITSQHGSDFQVGGKYKKQWLGIGDGFKVKVLKVDKVNRVAEFEVSGTWPKLGDSFNLTCRLLPSIVRVEGMHFDELMRPHTPKELAKVIQ